MNAFGAVMLLLGMMILSAGIWTALEQRLNLRTRLRRRFPVLGRNPWLVIGIMFGAVLLTGVILLLVSAPVAVYYAVGGLMTGTVIMLLSGNDSE